MRPVSRICRRPRRQRTEGDGGDGPVDGKRALARPASEDEGVDVGAHVIKGGAVLLFRHGHCGQEAGDRRRVSRMGEC